MDSAHANPQLLRDLNSELRRQPGSIVQALLDAILAERERASDRLNPQTWGTPPGAAQVRQAAADNVAVGIARREAVLDGSLTRAETASRLHRSDQAVSGMLERGALLGLKQGREWRIPAWQLAPELAEGILPGLRELATVYLDGVVSLSEWVNRPNADLDDATPREALAKGLIAEVLGAARSE